MPLLTSCRTLYLFCGCLQTCLHTKLTLLTLCVPNKNKTLTKWYGYYAQAAKHLKNGTGITIIDKDKTIA